MRRFIGTFWQRKTILRGMGLGAMIIGSLWLLSSLVLSPAARSIREGVTGVPQPPAMTAPQGVNAGRGALTEPLADAQQPRAPAIQTPGHQPADAPGPDPRHHKHTPPAPHGPPHPPGWWTTLLWPFEFIATLLRMASTLAVIGLGVWLLTEHLGVREVFWRRPWRRQPPAGSSGQPPVLPPTLANQG